MLGRLHAGYRSADCIDAIHGKRRILNPFGPLIEENPQNQSLNKLVTYVFYKLNASDDMS
jgi:hypothetical protein